MAHATVALNVSRVSGLNRISRGKVVTVAPRAGVIQAGFRQLFENGARIDGAIISPAPFPNERMRLSPLGQIRVDLPSTELFDVYADDAKTPIFFYIAGQNGIFSDSLYPNEGESHEAALKRLAFFNRAAITLIKEAGIDPRILHCVDWPTALTIAYGKLDPALHATKTLFTYMDARFQGLFPSGSLAITGLTDPNFNKKYLDYWERQISLAQLGVLLADNTVVSSYHHIQEVLSGRRSDGKDWGKFGEVFRTAQNTGALRYLFHSHLSVPSLTGLDMDNPGLQELDTLLHMALAYQGAYTAVSPLPPDQVSQQHLVHDAARGSSTVDYTGLAYLQEVLNSPAVSPEDKSLIRSICVDFGSIEIAKALFAPVKTIGRFAKAAPKTPKDQDKLNAAQAFVGNVFKSLRSFDIDWGVFKQVVQNTFYGKPQSVIKLDAIVPHEFSSTDQAVTKAGMEHIGKSETPYSPFMLLTMAGGLGQRFGFQILFDAEKKTINIQKHLLSPQIIAALEEMGARTAVDERMDEVFLVPAKKYMELEQLFNTPFLELLSEGIKNISKEDEDHAFYLPKGTYTPQGLKYSLFEQQARALVKLSNIAGKKIFWTVMTSDDNDAMVRAFFGSNLVDGKYFGVLGQEMVKFFPQGNYPLVAKNGASFDIRFKDTGEVYSAANGHGGFYGIAQRAIDAIKEEHDHAVTDVMGCNIENLLFNLRLGDPNFIGAWVGRKISRGDMVVGLAATKSAPTEAMGILAEANNIEQVIEYNHPTFTAEKAFAYLSEKKGEVFFVRDAGDNILALDVKGLKAIFKPTYREVNWAEQLDWNKKKEVFGQKSMLEDGFALLSLRDVPHDCELFETLIVQGKLQRTGKTFLLNALGNVRLKYSQGNTNIFLVDARYIGLICDYKRASVREEHKTGTTPYQDLTKVERSIFGPFTEVVAYEHLLTVLRDFGGSIGISVVEGAREDCFEPAKVANDVPRALSALQRLAALHPELDWGKI